MTTKKESLANLTDVAKARKIANNTFEVIYKDGRKTIRLHSTDIVEFFPNENFRLYTGGYNSQTTKRRIRDYAKVWVHTQKGKGLIVTVPVYGYEGDEIIAQKHYYFKEGILFDEDLNCLNSEEYIPRRRSTKPREALFKHITDQELAVLMK